MKHLRRIAYSIGFGLLVTLLSFLFGRSGGEILAVPGMIIAGWIDLIAYSFAGPDEFPDGVDWPYCAVVFYALSFYGLSWVCTGLKQERQHAGKAKGEIQQFVGPERR